MLWGVDETIDAREVLLIGWMVDMLLLMGGYILCHIWLLAHGRGAFCLGGVCGWGRSCCGGLGLGLRFGMGLGVAGVGGGVINRIIKGL